MIQQLSDGRIIQTCQSKIDPSIKRGYVALKGHTGKLSYTGDFTGLKKWYNNQIKLANKAYSKSLMADLCGTSYSAMRRDMGYCS